MNLAQKNRRKDLCQTLLSSPAKAAAASERRTLTYFLHLSVYFTVYILYLINRISQMQETRIKLHSSPLQRTPSRSALYSLIRFFKPVNRFPRAIITLLELRAVYSP